MSSRGVLLIGAARAAAGLVLLTLCIIPPPVVSDGPVVCLFRRFFGVECLGCGMTRALSLAMHGDLGLALEANRLVLAALPALLAFIAVPGQAWFHLLRLGPFRTPALRHRSA